MEGLPGVAFILAIAAWMIVGALNSRRDKELKHETLRAMLAKEGEINPELLKEIMSPPLPPTLTSHSFPHKQGDGYRLLCIFSAITFFTGIGIGLLISLIGYSEGDTETVFAGMGVWALLTCISLGFLVASRFLEKPPAKNSTGKSEP